jgi:hypothetical protein
MLMTWKDKELRLAQEAETMRKVRAELEEGFLREGAPRPGATASDLWKDGVMWAITKVDELIQSNDAAAAEYRETGQKAA